MQKLESGNSLPLPWNNIHIPASYVKDFKVEKVWNIGRSMYYAAKGSWKLYYQGELIGEFGTQKLVREEIKRRYVTYLQGLRKNYENHAKTTNVL